MSAESLKRQKIDIILSRRIGDAILSIPTLICLHQLNNKYNSNLKIRVFCQPFIFDLLSPLNLFRCVKVNCLSKFNSHFYRTDKTFYLETTSKNLGYYSKESYGLHNSFKKIIKYSHNLECLNYENNETFLGQDLLSFLAKYGLSSYSMSRFGILFEMGYTTEQIINTFEFSTEFVNLNNYHKLEHSPKEKYLVFCTEAAYGKAIDHHRRWSESSYFEIAQKCYERFNIKSVFIGVDTKVELPDKPYMVDLRKKLDLFQLACLLNHSLGYVGNDTGPLHIANLMKKKSVGLYFRENILKDYCPIFPEYNCKLYKPESFDQVYNKVESFILDLINNKLGI